MHLTLVRQMLWADATVWAVVLASPAARADAVIRRTLHHIHLVQHIFLQAWLQQAIVVCPDTEFEAVEALAAYGRAAHEGLLPFVAQLSPEAFAADFREPWTDRFEARVAGGPAAVHTLGESVLHVPLHTAHHRGQVCSRLRALGVEPPTVDFVVWLWSGRPDPVWPSLVHSPAAPSSAAPTESV